MKKLIKILVTIYEVSKTYITVLGLGTGCILTAYAMHKTPFTGLSDNSIESINKVVTGDSAYYIVALTLIFMIGFFVEIGYGIYKWVKKRKTIEQESYLKRIDGE